MPQVRKNCHKLRRCFSSSFRDPEGNRVELFVNSAFYCAQPQRVEVDLGQPEDRIWGAIQR